MKHDGRACAQGKHSTNYPAYLWCPLFRRERLDMHAAYCQEVWRYVERKRVKEAAKRRLATLERMAP